jgi:ATP-dependent protease HslVU (ClpYQ) peptidase subunit
MVVADADISLSITGNGDVLEPHDGLIGEYHEKPVH